MRSRNIKNIIAATLMLALAAGSFTGCGDNAETPSASDSSIADNSSADERTTEAPSAEAPAEEEEPDEVPDGTQLNVINMNGVSCDLNTITLRELGINESWSYHEIANGTLTYEVETPDYDLRAIKCQSRGNGDAPYLCIQGVFNENHIAQATNDEEKEKFTKNVGRVLRRFGIVESEEGSAVTDVISFTVSRKIVKDEKKVSFDFYTFAGGVKLGMTKDEVQNVLGKGKSCSNENTYLYKKDGTLMFVVYEEENGAFVVDEISIIKEGFEHPRYD